MFTEILGVITPVIVIIVFGFIVGYRQTIPLNTVNKLNIEVFCPLLVYTTLSQSDVSITTFLPLIAGGVLIVLGSGLLAWFVARLLGLPIKAICPTSMFNNCGNMGLPLGFFAAGEIGLQIFVGLFVISNAMHFTIGSKLVGGRLRWINIFGSPMMVATYAGVLVNYLGINLSAPIETGLKMMGDVTVPLMLFSLGVRMCDFVWKDLRIGIIGGILCPATGLVLALMISPLLGLTGLQKQMFFLFAVMPPAVLNFMLAEKYQVEEKSVASIVLIGNMLAIVFVPIGLLLGYPS